MCTINSLNLFGRQAVSERITLHFSVNVALDRSIALAFLGLDTALHPLNVFVLLSYTRKHLIGLVTRRDLFETFHHLLHIIQVVLYLHHAVRVPLISIGEYYEIALRRRGFFILYWDIIKNGGRTSFRTSSLIVTLFFSI